MDTVYYDPYYTLDYNIREPLDPEERRIARRVTRDVLARTDAAWSGGVWVAFSVFFCFIFLLLIFAPVTRYRSSHYTASTSYEDTSYHPHAYAYSPYLVLLLLGGGLLLCCCVAALAGGFYWYQKPVVVVKKDDDEDNETKQTV